MAIAITPTLIGAFERRYAVDHRDPTVASDLETYARGWNDHAAQASAPAARKAQHPDDIAVDLFAAAMKAKLAKKRAEGRSGWSDKSQCSAAFLSGLLRDHIGKGDPLDVGNLAMMLHQRGEAIVPAAGNAQDAARLDFLATRGAWVAWSRDRECCRVFHVDADGQDVPMCGWGDGKNWLTPREAIDAAIAAQRKGGA